MAEIRTTEPAPRVVTQEFVDKLRQSGASYKLVEWAQTLADKSERPVKRSIKSRIQHWCSNDN